MSENKSNKQLGIIQKLMDKLIGYQQSEREIIGFVHTLAATVDAKDPSTQNHSRNVAYYAKAIAEALGFSQAEVNAINTAAILHDIGKIVVPESILLKPGPLDDNEWEIIKSHPEQGVSILSNIDGLKNILSAVYHHHEKYDGSGYPKGLKGNQIPIFARILAVADAFDAMTSGRLYSRSNEPDQALVELKRCCGIQFDPKIVAVFEKLYHTEFELVGSKP